MEWSDLEQTVNRLCGAQALLKALHLAEESGFDLENIEHGFSIINEILSNCESELAIMQGAYCAVPQAS